MRNVAIAPSEATIQAEFYHQCRLLSATCHLEFVSEVGRLDILLLGPNNNAIAIIECKGYENPSPYSAQMISYRSLGLPVYLLNAFKDAAPLADKLLSLHGEDEGIPLYDLMVAAEGNYGKARATRRKLKLLHSLEQSGSRFRTAL